MGTPCSSLSNPFAFKDPGETSKQHPDLDASPPLGGGWGCLSHARLLGVKETGGGSAGGGDVPCPRSSGSQHAVRGGAVGLVGLKDTAVDGRKTRCDL